jgi:predicted dehydrogenase
MTAPRASTPASIQPVNVALIGLNFGGGIAHQLQANVKSLKIVGACDQDMTKAVEVGSQLGTCVYDSFDAVLRDDAVEAVGLFTGPHGRAGLIAKALKAGKHVITTKPFELDVQAAARVLDEAERRNLVVHLNSPSPAPSRDLQIIRNWAEDHQLGRPLSLHVQTWAHYREEPNGSWYDDPQLCPAAPILRLGIYFLNDFAPLLGPPRRVFASQSRLFTKRPTADHAQASIEFKGGGLATVFSSFCTRDGEPYRDQVLLNFENGTIRRWMLRPHLPDMSHDSAVLELTTGGRVYGAQTEPGDYSGCYQWDAFAQAIRSGQSVGLEYKARVLYGLRLLDSIRRSLDSGLPEPVSNASPAKAAAG